MKTSRLLTITILALFVGFVYLLVDSLARKPVTDPESRPSTFFTDETGARASFLLLREVLGSSSVEQIKEPLWSLAPPDQGGPSTVIVAGPAIGLLPLEAEQLEYWVSEGGQLVLFLDDDWVVEDSVPLLSRFGVSFRTDDGKERVVALKSPALSLRVERKASFKGEFDALVEGEEEILAVAISSGEGRVVVFPDPSVLTNRAIGEADNAVWLVRLSKDWGDGTVAFDEFHHGLGARTGFLGLLKSFLTSIWGLPFLHLAVLGLIYTVVNRRRLGRAVQKVDDHRRDPELLIRSRAGLLAATSNYQFAMERFCSELAYQMRDLSGRPANLEILSEGNPKIARLLDFRQLAADSKMKEREMLEGLRLIQEIREDHQIGN